MQVEDLTSLLKLSIVSLIMANRILVVDDDPTLRELYDEVLKTAGYTIEFAVDGEEGLNKIRTGGYDLVLLDVMMPKLDGLGVLTKLQTESPKPAKMPVIIVWTNLSHDPAIKEAMQKGATNVLVKADLAPNQVVAMVQKYLPTVQPTSVNPQPTPVQPLKK
jgi:CheY-like chemotaxis protein